MVSSEVAIAADIMRELYILEHIVNDFMQNFSKTIQPFFI
jgi:hypothetical protein